MKEDSVLEAFGIRHADRVRYVIIEWCARCYGI